jgi:hypothetical protein
MPVGWYYFDVLPSTLAITCPQCSEATVRHGDV